MFEDMIEALPLFLHPNALLAASFGIGIILTSFYRDHCFSNWVPRNLMVPQSGVKGSERRKCVLAEELYWLF